MTPPLLSPASRRFVSVLRIVCWLFLLAAGTSSPASETAIKSFNIPAEAGDQALKRFTAQSGVEVVFGTAAAAQVRTNAVKADFALLDANDIFLYETGTEGTGIFTNFEFDRNGYPTDNTTLL